MSIKKLQIDNFIAIEKRLKKELGLKTSKQLIEILGIPQPTYSRRKAKDTFSPEWVLILSNEYNFRNEWIITGKGPKKLNEGKTRGKPENDFLQLVDEWLQELTKAEPQRAEWFKFHFEDSFPAFKKWLRGKER